MYRTQKTLTRAEKIKLLNDISRGKVKPGSLQPKPVLIRNIWKGYDEGKPDQYLYQNRQITEEEFIKLGGDTDRSITLNIRIVTTGRKPVYSEKDIED